MGSSAVLDILTFIKNINFYKKIEIKCNLLKQPLPALNAIKLKKYSKPSPLPLSHWERG